MSETILETITPEQALEALAQYVQGAREAAFGDFPALPAGISYSADVAGIVVLADEEEENLFLDVLLRDVPALLATNTYGLHKLVSDQLSLLRALVAHYELLADLTACEPVETEEE